MRLSNFRMGVVAAVAIGTMTSGAAYAGGLEANGYDWELLFDPDTYAARASTTYVHVDQPISNTAFDPSGDSVGNSLDRIYYNLGFKADLTGDASCLVSGQNPWGSGTERDVAYARDLGKAARERLHSFDAGLTCAYGLDLGAGVISVIGGISAQHLSYDADIANPFAPGTTLPLGIDGWGTGWRAGVAYEIEEYALRVSAIYNAAVDYDLDGSFAGGGATADATTPQTVELRAQTGIAPGWLALASVKWVDWSILESLDVDTEALGTISSDFFYRDGWVVSGGIGHQLTDELSLLGRVTWDRGTSNPGAGGVLDEGSQTDRWGLSLGASYDAVENVQFSGGVSLSTLGDGSNTDGETWDRGYVLAINGGFKGTF